MRDDLSKRTFLVSVAVVAASAAACYVSAALSNPILERAEVFFAESAREMLASGRYATPYYLGHPFFDKPILTYWFIAASFRVFGISRTAARVPSVVAAILTILLTAFGTAGIAGRRAGVAAACVLASSYVFFYQASLSMSDMCLTLFCALTVALLFAGNRDAGRRTLLWWLASVSCALAVLTKGPIGLVLPVAAFLLYLALTSELRQIRPRHIAAGAATVTAIAGAWFFWLWRANGTGALYAFFVVENVRRFTGESYDTKRSVAYVPLSLLGDFLPWAGFLLLALWRWRWTRHPHAASDPLEHRGQLLLWCYVCVVTGFFWLSRFQIEYYLLPAIPPCAAVVGAYLSRALTEKDRLANLVTYLMGTVVLGAGMVASERGFLRREAGWSDLRLPALWFVGCGAAILLFLIRGRPLLAWGTLAIALCAGLAVSSQAEFSLYERALGISDIAQAMQRIGAAVPFAVSPDLEGWAGELAFRMGSLPQTLQTPAELADFLRGPGIRAAIVSDDWPEKLPSDLHARIVFHGPVLIRKVTRAALLDSAALDADREQFAVIASDGSAPRSQTNAPSAGR